MYYDYDVCKCTYIYIYNINISCDYLIILIIPDYCVRYQIMVWSESRVLARGFIELVILGHAPIFKLGHIILSYYDILCILQDNISYYIKLSNHS